MTATARCCGVTVTLLALLAIAGCGSDSGTDRDEVAAASTPSATAPPPVRRPGPVLAQAAAPAAPTQLGTGTSDPTAGAPRATPPLIVPGNGVFATGTAGAPSGDASPTAEGDVTFNFVNADVRDVVREILGNELHLNYVVDSKVQATITAQTGAPVPRSSVVPTLESVLRANGLALLDVNGLYRVVPIEEAAKSSAGAVPGSGGAGYAVRVMPLRYVAAAEIKSVLEPFLPPGGVIQVDAARNMIIVTGPGADMGGFIDLVRQFDVDWLAGTSFALYPLRVSLAKDVVADLDPIFGDSGKGPLAGLVRIIPVDRLNAILVISPQRGYLTQVKTWIDRFDYGDDQVTPRVFQYHVQNSRAVDLAAVLTQLLSSGGVSTVGPSTAPGTKQIDLTSGTGAGAIGLTSGLSGAGGATGGVTPGLPSMTGTGTPATGGLTPTSATGATTPPLNSGGAGAQHLALQPGLGGGGPGTSGGNELQMPEVRIVADEKNNALIIYAHPRDYRMIEDVIKRLDVVPLQVLIEATIAEVTLNDNLQYGLQWFFNHASSNLELTNSASGIGAAADILGVFPGFNYIVGGGKAKVVLSALASLTDVDVVSSPELLVLDHQSAALQVGDQVPIITQTAQSVVTTGAPVVNSVSYLNTGVILQVTPRVNDTGLITLDIDQSVSDVSSTTTSTINSPTISQRRIVTSAVVQDGETIALGGLIIDNRNNSRNGVPVLGDIPVLGALFNTTSKSLSRTELLVLLTPRIIRNAKDARDMTDDLRERMRAVKPLELKTQ